MSGVVALPNKSAGVSGASLGLGASSQRQRSLASAPFLVFQGVYVISEIQIDTYDLLNLN